MKPRTKQILTSLGLVLLLVAVLAGIKIAQFGAMAKAGESYVPPPEAVTTAKVESAQWQSKVKAVGSLVAVQGVTLSSEVGGTVREIAFKSGDVVDKGELLVRLDTSTERAALASAQASLGLTRLDLKRAKQLREGNVTSESELDIAVAREAEAAAAVQSTQAAVAKKVLRAPFSGRLGIRQVNLGEVLEPGRPIVTLQSYDPIYVDFFVPQQALADVAVGNEVRLTSRAFVDRSWQGKVETIDAQVDPNTRNVRVRALVRNADGKLLPGMFGDVEVLRPQMREVLTIAGSAVLHAPYGDSVFVVIDKEGQLTAEQRFIRLGERRGDLVAVESGLEPGQTVVSTGAFKLRNGVAVAIHNALAPEVEANPNPENE